MRSIFLVVAVPVTVVLGAFAACSVSNAGNEFGPGAATTGAGGNDQGGGSGASGGGILREEPSCPGDHSNEDQDGDGWTGADGDCNDCTPQMNPGALDYPGNGVDEDCDGTPDDTPVSCDDSLALDSGDALDGARAMGLCKEQSGASWGVVSASWVTADGTPLSSYDPDGLGHGILAGFGQIAKPQEGGRLLALSSGTARQPSDAGYEDVSGYDKGYVTGSPPGYPKESPSCPGVITGEPHDSAGLLIKVRTPSNAKSFRFDLNFFTYEFPNFICSKYNDFFVAMLSSATQPPDNVSFDPQGNTISVNAGFLEVCGCEGGPPCKAPPFGGANQKVFTCALGTEQLVGTGFEGNSYYSHAATGWLETTAAVPYPGEDVELLFTIWDSGDGVLDSTVLLDNFAFDVDPAPTETEPVPGGT